MIKKIMCADQKTLSEKCRKTKKSVTKTESCVTRNHKYVNSRGELRRVMIAVF